MDASVDTCWNLQRAKIDLLEIDLVAVLRFRLGELLKFKELRTHLRLKQLAASSLHIILLFN